MTSPRNVRGNDDVIDGQVLVPAEVRRTRGFNESFRAAVDRSYTKRQAAALGQHYTYCLPASHLHLIFISLVLAPCGLRKLGPQPSDLPE